MPFLLAYLLLPLTAWASDSVRCEIAGIQRITCSIIAQNAFDHELRLLLESGFTNTLVYHFFLFRNDIEQPISTASVTFAEVFHLYTDVYYISREGRDGYVEAANWGQAIRELARFHIEIRSTQPLTPGSHLVTGVLQVNPLSEQHLAEAASWIARARGGSWFFGLDGGSLFGPFVNFFLDTDQRSAELIRHLTSTTLEILP